MSKIKMKTHLCPVCKKHEFPFRGTFYVCDECGWIDDPFQADNPDEDCLANTMSLNEARKAYAEGRDVE